MAKILIIEDTENNRVLLTRRLRPRGYDIITAEDAEKGLLLVEGEPVSYTHLTLPTILRV